MINKNSRTFSIWKELTERGTISNNTKYEECIEYLANRRIAEGCEDKMNDLNAFKNAVEDNGIYVEYGDEYFFEYQKELIGLISCKEDENLLKKF